ncbi:Transmembrane protease serine 11D [Coemansia erecta]|nr:Transmembrane protease serine 11D [Coemansia sp. RSA 2618]KAJ2816752.1 Transmembrane protease serine 11D [Coemansia erecta]
MSFDLVKRIVGGSPAPSHAYPFAVYLSIETQPSWHAVCGGTLISATHVVTAAHCVHHAPRPSAVKLGLGSAHIRRQQRHQARNITVHPHFDMRTLANDIAVVHLDRPVAMTPDVHRIPVYFGDIGAGTRIVTMGWGVTTNRPGARTVAALNHVQLRVAEPRACRSVDPEFASSNGPFICTSTQPGARDECNGDSGAPAVVDMADIPPPLSKRSAAMVRAAARARAGDEGSDLRLVALTSYGDNARHDAHPPCGDPSGFGFSTHIAYYEQFLTAATGLGRAQLEAPVRLDRHALKTSSAAAGLLLPPHAVWLQFMTAVIVALALMCR